jgi:VanZ family protein
MLAWGLAFALLAANVAGYAFDLYAAFWWFDRVLHAATILALTFWLAVMVLGEGIRAGRAVLFVVLIASVGVAVGALWEVAEWVFDRFAPGDVIKGKDDTVIDIVMDTIGAVAAAALALRFQPDTALPTAALGESARVR